MNANPSRNWDIKLFLFLIPCINVVNYYLTYNPISVSWHTVITFLIDTIQGFAAWLLVRYIIFYLDKKLPFEDAFVRRIVLQIACTLLAGVMLIILLTEVENKIATNKPVPREFYTTDIFIIGIWFFVVNGIYITRYLYDKWQQNNATKENEERIREETRKLSLNGFMIKTGKIELRILYDEIAGFFTDGEYVVCSTLAEKKYLLNFSLETIEKEVPSVLFFRLNRQLLIHRQLVIGFKRIENGKLNVLIKPYRYITDPITVSRTKASLFKAWFQPEEEDVSI